MRDGPTKGILGLIRKSVFGQGLALENVARLMDIRALS